MAKTDQGLLWGGLGLAAVVGLVMARRKADAAAAAPPAALSPYPSIPSGGYKPPVMTAPGYMPPVVGAAPPPVVVAPPPVVVAPAPAVVIGQTAAQANAAFDAAMASAHAMQRDDFNQGVAALQARVASGEISTSSPQYRETFDYLANLTGGVATQAAEAAKITAAGLPPPA